MNRVACLILILFLQFSATPQDVQTIVPARPVTAGTAFQVQYVVTGAPASIESAPLFDSLRVVSGPHIYKGRTVVKGQNVTIENIIYTLVPSQPGKYRIPGVVVSINGSAVKSGDAYITVVPQPKVSFTATSGTTDVSLYAPSRGNMEKTVGENHFIKTEVSKRDCYEGEPVVATFKLYSRLQSSSEVVKTPSLYGFSAVDMLDINKAHQSVEKLGDKVYNISILRKVQLYPAQSGKQMIDPMHLRSEIEFRDSFNDARKTVVEKEIRSAPMAINVKALPAERPDSYSGAVGQFTLQSSIENTELAVNGQGKLTVTIAGRGNFIQFNPPALQWPSNVEYFELPSTDDIRNDRAPAEGKRTWQFGFTASHTGHYVLPPVNFSYFNPASGRFVALSTDSLRFEVTAHKKTLTSVNSDYALPSNAWWIILCLLLLGGIGIIIFRKRIASKVTTAPQQDNQPDYPAQLSALPLTEMNDKQAALAIRQLLSVFMKHRHGTDLVALLQHRLPQPQWKAYRTLTEDCELIAYASIDSDGRKEDLRRRAKELIG